MADMTTNYGMQKPLPEEKYNVAVHNMNMDIIDSALKRMEIKNASLGESFGDFEIESKTEPDNQSVGNYWLIDE